jgi:hypothetical protein
VSRYKADDVGLLLPSFQPVIRELLRRMEMLGYEPVPFDTLRTAEEALRNAQRGSGIVDSIHRHGAACDIICGVHGWSCAQHGCDFYNVLGREAHGRGLVWGGSWPKRDLPHVQAITVAEQKQLRALETWEEKDAFVAARLRRR